MPPFAHRDPGVIGENYWLPDGLSRMGSLAQLPGFCWRLTGLLGTGAERKQDFFFGIISDGIHCHPATVRRLSPPCSAPSAFVHEAAVTAAW